MTAANNSAFLQAVRRGDVGQVQALLASGASPEAKDKDGTTALMFAAQSGYTEIVRSLLAAGAEANTARAKFGITALMLAAANNQVDSLQTLLTHGADVNAQN